MARQLHYLGAGYDRAHGEIFITVEQVGLVTPSSRMPLNREAALDCIRGLAAALQADDRARGIWRAS